MSDINVTVGTDEINVTVGTDIINLTTGTEIINVATVGTIVTASYIAEGNKFYFDGAGGDTYLWKNPGNNRLELYVDGVLKADWGE